MLRAILALFLSIAAAIGAAQETTRDAASTTNTVVPPERTNVPGLRFSASLGELYVPPFFDSGRTTATDVVVFFHGAQWVVEQNFYDARKNAVLITVSLGEYGPVFRDPAMLEQVLSAAREHLRTEAIAPAPYGKICLASFSGGYSAVREILRHPEFGDRVSDVVLADSLYAPRVKGTTDQLDPPAMQPFVDFARRAAASERTFLFSHLYPPEERYRGNTTTLAASYLIDAIGAQRTPATGRNSRGAELLYRADLGGFHVLGYSGMTNQDHFEHLFSVSDLLRQTSLQDAGR
jgi:hypothetical protein